MFLREIKSEMQSICLGSDANTKQKIYAFKALTVCWPAIVTPEIGFGNMEKSLSPSGHAKIGSWGAEGPPRNLELSLRKSGTETWESPYPLPAMP